MVRLKDTVDRTMFYGAKPDTFIKAKLLREKMTPQELKLYDSIKDNKILGLRFKAQHPIDQFVVDFYCHRIKLVIELDGEIHNFSKEYDTNRTFELERFGLRVIRFTNNLIDRNIDMVVEKIKEVCLELLRQSKT